jgi:hypothetical protein
MVGIGSRSDSIKAEPPGHHRQPSANVGDRLLVGTGQPKVGLLDHILGFADVAQHLVGQVDQIRPVMMPGLREGPIGVDRWRITHIGMTT